MLRFEAHRAFDHLDKLAYEIGPRLAGTRGDRLATEYIRKQFESFGLKVRVREFGFVDRSLRTKCTAGLFFTAFLSLFFLSPLGSLSVWLAALIVWRSLVKILPKRSTQNILASLKPKKTEKRVVITAHHDSARSVVSYNLHLFVRLTFIPALVVSTIFVCARVLHPSVFWTAVWGGLAGIFLPVCISMFICASGRGISPGAIDNASGVSVMLEVARVSSEQPPPATELTFVAFGAEEQGLVGAWKLVASKVLPKDVSVLNLDVLGAGPQAFFVEGNGVVRRVETDPELNRALVECGQKVGPRLKPWWAAFAGHDHIPLRRAGIRATTLTFDVKARKGKLSLLIAKLFQLPNASIHKTPHIHTLEDTPEKIRPENIERAGQIVTRFIEAVG